MTMSEHGEDRLARVLERGVRTSVRNNASAYGFSVMITAAFGVLTAALGSPRVGDVFLYAGGAVLGVTIVEGLASRGFRIRLRGEQSDVVALGSAFGFASVGLAVGAAALAAELLGGWLGWLIGPLLASSLYVVASGIEMSLARVAQKRREAQEKSN